MFRRFINLAFLAIFTLLSYSCTNNERVSGSKQSFSLSNNSEDTVSTQNGDCQKEQDLSLCGMVGDFQDWSAEFSKMIEGLCQNDQEHLKALRARHYKGHGAPEIEVRASANELKQLELSTILLARHDPLSVYNLFRLEYFRANDFKSEEKFQLPADVKYTSYEGKDPHLSVRFEISGKPDEEAKKYQEDIQFHVIKEKELYVLTFDRKAIDSPASQQRRILLIHKANLGEHTVTEIVALSDYAVQDLESESEVSVLKNKATLEAVRIYRNALHANIADGIFGRVPEVSGTNQDSKSPSNQINPNDADKNVNSNGGSP